MNAGAGVATSRARRVLVVAADVALVFAVIALAHPALIALLEIAFAAALHRNSGGTLDRLARSLAGLAFFAAALWFFRRRVRDRAPADLVFYAALALYVPAGYALSRRGEHVGPPHRWDDHVWNHQPSHHGEMHVGRAPVSHDTTNSHGFRAPEWTEAHPPGVVRGVVLGDSYVYGIGVDDDDTLPVLLQQRLNERAPAGVRYEILNLGVPGTNIISYPRIYRAAVRRLAPDFVMQGFTLPNDLAPWDSHTASDAQNEFSAFTVSAFLIGPRITDVGMLLAILPRSIGPDEVELWNQQMDVFAEARAHPPAPPLVFYSYGAGLPSDPRGRVPGLIVFPRLQPIPGGEIPGDGHPSGLGNRHYAPILADAFFADPTLSALRPPR